MKGINITMGMGHALYPDVVGDKDELRGLRL